jgi:hypothetical protein
MSAVESKPVFAAEILNGLGKLSHCAAIPPRGTSMLKALRKSAGVLPEEIKAIRMQTCTLENPYLLSLAKHLIQSGVNPGIDLEIMGVGDANALEISSFFTNLKPIQAIRKPRSHFNIISTNDSDFLWSEPDHDDSVSSLLKKSCGEF